MFETYLGARSREQRTFDVVLRYLAPLLAFIWGSHLLALGEQRLSIERVAAPFVPPPREDSSLDIDWPEHPGSVIVCGFDEERLEEEPLEEEPLEEEPLDE